MGLALAIGARIVFLAAEVLAAVSGDDDNVLLLLGALGTAVGLVVLGVTAARRRSGAVSGPGRFAVLLAGVYPFVVMFPIVAATGEPSVVAIALWGLPLMLVGLAMLGVGREVGGSSAEGRGPTKL